MNFDPAAAVSVLINHNHHLNNSSINGSLSISSNSNNNNSDTENFVQFDSPVTPATTNHSKSMEWTNDDALELIEQYRNHTELWNRSDPKYKDKLCRFRAWSEIAERFQCSKAEVERKMNVLLTQYRREKHKMLVKLYQGIQPSPSKWYAFKRFDFMETGGAISSGSAIRNRVDSGNTSGTGAGISGISGTSGADSNQIAGSNTNGGHNIAVAALNELRNFDSSSAVAAAASSSSSTSTSTATTGAATHHHPHLQAHRRFKSKEMKYFGSMGLNLPMLIANTQTLDSWNSVGQFSPPIGSGDRSQLRVPLPLTFGTAATASDLGVTNTPGRSIFGGSSSSDLTASPQKPMETTDIDDERELKCEHDMSTAVETEGSEQNIQQAHQQRDLNGSGNNAVGNINPIGSDGGSNKQENDASPTPNTKAHDAHMGNRQIHSSQHPLHRQHVSRSEEDLEIKEELVDYFHAPHPPAPPSSHRSYSSNDERLGGSGGGGIGGCGTATDSDDFAQDLRISAAVAAAAKSIDFTRFVLPRNLRRSTDSNDEEKFTPLNMRKLSNASAGGRGITPTSAAAVVTSAGQMLMNTLLSHESLSNDTTGSGRGVGGGVKSEASTSGAATGFYAENLNKDDCDFIGSNVSVKLRAMDRDQRIIAEKLISEVLFFGQFNELERTARIQPK